MHLSSFIYLTFYWVCGNRRKIHLKNLDTQYNHCNVFRMRCIHLFVFPVRKTARDGNNQNKYIHVKMFTVSSILVFTSLQIHGKLLICMSADQIFKTQNLLNLQDLFFMNYRFIKENQNKIFASRTAFSEVITRPLHVLIHESCLCERQKQVFRYLMHY